MLRLSLPLLATLLAVGTSSVPFVSSQAEELPATAWHDGALRTDPAGLVSRSDLVQKGPAWRAYQAMPLGNGVLGAAVWAEKGYTAQLNRVDTFPELKSAGRLVVPGLQPLMRAADYTGRLAMYDGQVVQHGGGMSARSYVRADADQFVLEVTGADPGTTQTADLKLWEGRTPTAAATGAVAALAETFRDAASGSLTGAVAAMTARARDVSASVIDPLTVRITFRPNADGSFRLVVGVPSYQGGDVAKAARRAVAESRSEHLDWWHAFWAKAAPLRITSADGTGEYVETLRTLQLYTMAASMRSPVPSTHGGVVRMFSSAKDQADWAQDSYWHFNLRMLISSNLGAGIGEFNAPYFRFYLDRAELMKKWTHDHWIGAQGTCLPEFLRYDGTGDGCDNMSEPGWVKRILSSGPELVNNIWWQYRYTGDRALLDRAYPLIRDIAEFHLTALTPGEDGYLHLEHVNALEVQWDTDDPAPDLAAMRVIFPIVADLAAARGDSELAARLRTAVGKLPPFRTVQRGGEEVIAWSGTDEEAHNTQNPEMEVLWPWGLFDESSELMQATYRQRVYPQDKDWGMDTTWAARLGLADEVKRLLLKGIEDFQIFPNGFTVHRTGREPVRQQSFYNEWGGVLTTGLQEALVQSYDDVVDVAPAWPREWDVAGSVEIEGGHRISTEVRDGVVSLVGIEAGSRESLQVRNPWAGQEVRVVDSRGRTLVGPSTDEVITVPVLANHSYVVERVAVPLSSFEHVPLTGQAATEVKTVGSRMLGVPASEPPVLSDLVTVRTPDKLSNLVKAQPGAEIYVDRSYTITDLPASLTGEAMVPGSNDDSKRTGPADYITLDLTAPATVYVAFDPRGENDWWPTWLNDYTRTGETVGTTDQRLLLFARDVPAGQLALGANSAVEGKGNSSYITFITPR
ncbi:glycoside hydrolase [Kribbella turkmenica]|uniref:Glycoside hydrolase n=1 Tax=Kribbella turkmenica TaxID=2530375 RepID=A0A4R4XIT4_9ACTN|nr:glycoside hydrolase [Kribbella turkmenica]TDD30589.1 glycoside hydrolase [Kribbella turkmenica]